jgi:hypothetical protein
MLSRAPNSTTVEIIYQKLTRLFHDVSHDDSLVMNAGLTAPDVEDLGGRDWQDQERRRVSLN